MKSYNPIIIQHNSFEEQQNIKDESRSEKSAFTLLTNSNSKISNLHQKQNKSLESLIIQQPESQNNITSQNTIEQDLNQAVEIISNLKMTLGIMEKYVNILNTKNNSNQVEPDEKKEFDEIQVQIFETNTITKNKSNLADKTQKILHVLKKMQNIDQIFSFQIKPIDQNENVKLEETVEHNMKVHEQKNNSQSLTLYQIENLDTKATVVCTGSITFQRNAVPLNFVLYSKEKQNKIKQFMDLSSVKNHTLRCQHFQYNMSAKVLKTIQTRYYVLQRNDLLWIKGFLVPENPSKWTEFQQFIQQLQDQEQVIKIKQKHAAVYLTSINQIKKYLPQFQIENEQLGQIAFMFYGEIENLKKQKSNFEQEPIELKSSDKDQSGKKDSTKKRKYTSYNIKNQLTLQQKLEAVYLAEKTKNKSKTARIFGVDRNSVANWVKKKKLLESIPEQLRRCRMKQIEQFLENQEYKNEITNLNNEIEKQNLPKKQINSEYMTMFLQGLSKNKLF